MFMQNNKIRSIRSEKKLLQKILRHTEGTILNRKNIENENDGKESTENDVLGRGIEKTSNFPAATKSTGRLSTFFALAFLIGWPILILAFLTKEMIPEGLPVNNIGFLMVIAPITSAFILVYKENGLDAAKRLLKRSFNYRRIPSKIWYLPIFFLPLVIYAASLGSLTLMGVQFPEFQFSVVAVPILFLLFVIFGICEEVGWQGYAFGRMETRWKILNASILLGLVWALWHIPGFVIQDPTGGLIWIVGQCINLVVTRVLIVWIFVKAGKSLFAAILFHAMINVCQMIHPFYSSPLAPIIADVFTIVVIAAFAYFSRSMPPNSIIGGFRR